jgi:4-hydroxy-3-methylbut-2-enyl diphosphate reductase (EC 1.17.1.2)
MRSFDIPEFYRSPVISRVKAHRKALDPRKQDFSPSLLDFGSVKVQLARHFGFCFGVENAIEISYKAIEENPGKRIFLLSQMIHNPEVNADLESRGVKFLQDTQGNALLPLSTLGVDDVVIVPAFGATVEMENQLRAMGVDVKKYNTTCPFVEKVWKRSAQLGEGEFTVVIHGKPNHEETRATFSHAAEKGHALVVKDGPEAEFLATWMEGDRSDVVGFWARFEGRATDGFDPLLHLDKVGVVNQTTMLATDTQAIADRIKQAVDRNGQGEFANTRDTLCYATNDNQSATLGALEAGGADLALVVGGYNSSNTSHLVELCEKKLPTFFVRNELEWKSDGVHHFNIHSGEMEVTPQPFPVISGDEVPTVLLTSGASCPDASVERVLSKVLAHYGGRDVDVVLTEFEKRQP